MVDIMKIMVVEDSNTLRYIIVKLLKEFGYKDFAAVDSAEEALGLLANQSYDLILLDWNLPKMSGFDFLKLIRTKPEYNKMRAVSFSSAL